MHHRFIGGMSFLDNLWQQLLPASWQLTLFIFFFVYILRYKQENKFSMQLHVLLKFLYAVILILNAVLFLVESQRDFLFMQRFSWVSWQLFWWSSRFLQKNRTSLILFQPFLAVFFRFLFLYLNLVNEPKASGDSEAFLCYWSLLLRSIISFGSSTISSGSRLLSFSSSL